MSVENFPKPWQRILADMSSGGSSDEQYSIASVTMTNNATGLFRFVVPNIFEDTMLTFIDYADIDGETPFNIVLYNGSVVGTVVVEDSDEQQVIIDSVDGDIELTMSNFDAKITGNGSITFADAQI